jgi:hypothetical protein
MMRLCPWCPGGWKVDILSDDNFTSKSKRLTSGRNMKLFAISKR